MAGVAVGPATRAYRENSGINAFARTPGGSVAVGAGTRAYQQGVRPGYAPPAAKPAAWTPPPVPPGLYNPIRDVELAEGKRGSEQTTRGLERQKASSENRYGVNLAEVGQREGNQKAAHEEMLARLGESFKRLGARQEDQANAGNTNYGGALIAAGLARAGNEATRKASEQRTFGESQQANAAARGRLALGESEATGPGGSLTEALQNAGENQQGFEQSVGGLKNTEASEHGYRAPTGPSPSSAGAFNKVNPVTKEHFREIKVGGKTVHEYHSGRKVTVR